jgi:signal transduction histidine kinase
MIIVIANGLTITFAAAMVLLVLWEAPNRRLNQALGLAMFSLVMYCLSNTFSRFAEVFNLNPTLLYQTILNFYGTYSASMLIFITLLAKPPQKIHQGVMLIVLILTPIIFFASLNGEIVTNVRVVEGALVYDAGRLFALGLVASTSTPLIGIPILWKSSIKDRKRLVLALIFTLGGVFNILLRPLIGSFPINAIGLLIAIYIIGESVLRSQWFNPLVEMNQKLHTKNRELQQIAHLKGQFMSGVSQGLRAPLNSVIGYTSLVMQGAYGPLTDKQQDRLERIHDNGKHLLDIISDILDLNQIEGGQLRLTFRSIGTEPLVENVWGVIEPHAAKRNIWLKKQIQPGLPQLLVDEQRARQILINLLFNAIKFTKKGGVALRIRRLSINRVIFEIEDTGIGIPQEKYDEIFEEFIQVQGGTNRPFDGVGLGLAITKRLVEMHGGEIWLESTQGVGTTFYVTLPCVV